MKKVYIPTEEELQQLNYLGINPYNYLLSKTVETLIMEDIIYGEIDMLDIAYEQLSEFPELVYSICKIYPEAIASSELASKNIDLARLLTKKIIREDKTIYQLDNLSYFDQESDVISDIIVIENTVKNLSEHLTSTPRYRFDYRGPNILLDNIFSCELPIDFLSTDLYDDLISIDPIYITKLGIDLDKEKRNYSQKKSFGLSRGLIRYLSRYNMEEPNSNDQQEKTKKLIRYLDSHKQNYQQNI